MMKTTATVKDRFYPRWPTARTLSKVHYGIDPALTRPSAEQRATYLPIVKAFLYDLFELDANGQARIFTPTTLIHPVILEDGRHYFELFWKDKPDWERHVTDNIKILNISISVYWHQKPYSESVIRIIPYFNGQKTSAD